MKTIVTCLAAAFLLLGCGGDRTRAETGASVEITGYHDSSQAEDCKAFRVTKDVILAYFEVAQPTTVGDYVDNLFSPCTVSGVLRTAEGAREFVLQSSGVARITGDGGRAFVFAEPTWTDPFEGMYGNQD